MIVTLDFLCSAFKSLSLCLSVSLFLCLSVSLCKNILFSVLVFLYLNVSDACSFPCFSSVFSSYSVAYFSLCLSHYLPKSLPLSFLAPTHPHTHVETHTRTSAHTHTRTHAHTHAPKRTVSHKDCQPIWLKMTSMLPGLSRRAIGLNIDVGRKRSSPDVAFLGSINKKCILQLKRGSFCFSNINFFNDFDS